MVYREGVKEMQINITNRQLIRGISYNSSYEQVLQVTIEELAELQQACCKELRRISNDKALRKSNKDLEDSLREEIADTIIMLEQLQYKIMYPNYKLNQIINKKCLRTLEKNTHTKNKFRYKYKCKK